ncbi:MAG: UvrD-helicase domain-containing protein [Spirochaetales bacterium]|nr:UvrD-helicase domain-containing protein [Spirochaetales bacterium]
MLLDYSLDIDTKLYEEKLSRLASLQGTDPGVFVLAGQAFFESFFREALGYTVENDATFYKLTSNYQFAFDCYFRTKDLFSSLNAYQKRSNKVRHNFETLQPMDAGNMIDLIKRFCRAVGIGYLKGLENLQCPLSLWNSSENKVTLFNQVKRLDERLHLTAEQSAEMVAQYSQYQVELERLRSLEAELELKDEEIKKLESLKSNSSQKNDDLRREKFELKKKLKESQDDLARLTELEQYIETLESLSLFTKTKKDYEQSIMQLSDAQQSLIDKIDGRTDFLIMGAAGTGKTVVLIKAFEKIANQGASQLIEDGRESVFLTYTKTLVKYGRYLSEIISGREDFSLKTVDELLVKIGSELLPGYTFSYSYFKDNPIESDEFIPANLNLADEIENYILSNMIEREVYVSPKHLRRGQKTPLRGPVRPIVWNILEREKAKMIENKHCSANMYLTLLLEKLDSYDSPYQTFFIDEIQDLIPVKIMLLKKIARGGLVMAGDTSQSIYQPGFTFKFFGISIVGKSNYLYQNYRNTREIHAFADKYRKLCISFDEDDVSKTLSTRPGAPPELFLEKDADSLVDSLCSRIKFFIDRLGYDPSNIAVITTDKLNAKKIWDRLSALGVDSAFLKGDEFSFKENDSVVITSLQSAKGLDFPVVMFHLPKTPYVRDSLDLDTRNSQIRNLIYVGMTRAMENLQVFVRDSGDDLLQELIETFDKKEEK